jgi:hypothetical protein
MNTLRSLRESDAEVILGDYVVGKVGLELA